MSLAFMYDDVLKQEKKMHFSNSAQFVLCRQLYKNRKDLLLCFIGLYVPNISDMQMQREWQDIHFSLIVSLSLTGYYTILHIAPLTQTWR